MPVPAVYLLTRLAALAVCGFPPWSIYIQNGYRMVQPSPYSSCWSVLAVRSWLEHHYVNGEWAEGSMLVDGGALQHIGARHAMDVGC